MIRIPAPMHKKEQVEQQRFILYQSYSKGDITPEKTLLKVKCLFCFVHAAFLVRKAAGPNIYCICVSDLNDASWTNRKEFPKGH